MNAVTFLKNPLLSLPKSRNSGDFIVYMRQLFKEYKKLIDEVEGEDPLSKQIISERDSSKVLCDEILKALDNYQAGRPADAYGVIQKALVTVKPILTSFLPTDTPDKSDTRFEYLYRIRTSKEPSERFSRDQFFHIPFELRHKVAAQRFSIPGLPCLYLGGSIYVCWEEMGRPDFTRVHMTRFRAADCANLRILNIGYRPQFWVGWHAKNSTLLSDEQIQKKIGDHVLLWPLIVSCHIKVLHCDGAFKPEYVIPQILLQWVGETQDFDGISYTSTHIDDTYDQPIAQMNLVFPAKSSQSKGHCKGLIKQFELCDPLSWQLAGAIPVSQFQGQSLKNTQFTFMHVLDKQIEYHNTEFCMMEYRLCGLPCSKLPPNP